MYEYTHASIYRIIDKSTHASINFKHDHSTTAIGDVLHGVMLRPPIDDI